MAEPRPNPYVGPHSFTIADQNKFAGRDRDITALYRLLISERIVLLYSPSGAGKSSLVNAGMIPKMQERGFKVLPVVRVNQEVPVEIAQKARPNRYIMSVLQSLEENVPENERLSDAELASIQLNQYLTRRLCAENTDDEEAYEPKSFIVFDQFEEILTIDPNDRDGKWEFFSQVGDALEESSRWALFAMREDYIAALDPYLRLIPTRFGHNYRLDLLDFETALEAVTKPVTLSGAEYDPKAAEKLVNDLRSVRVQLPDGDWATQPELGRYVEPVQLQVVCYRLWDKIGEATQITEAHVEQFARVDDALGGYYAEEVGKAADYIDVPEKDIRHWFDTSLITRNNIRTQVMWEKDQSGGLNNLAVRYLEEKTHLIRAERRRGVKWYELSHDRLIEPVRKNNKEWFARNLSTLQLQAMLWESRDRPDYLLLRDERLTEAEQWAEKKILSQTESDFLKECRDQRSRLQAEQDKREAEAQRQRAEELDKLNHALKNKNTALRIRTLVSLGLASIAVIAGVFAFFQANYASQQATIAKEKEAVAVAAQATAEVDRKNAEAARLTAEDEKSKADEAAAAADRESKINLASKLATQAQTLIDSYPQRAALLALESLRVTENGGLDPLAASNDALRSTLRGNQGMLLVGHYGTPAMAFSPDDHWLATASFSSGAQFGIGAQSGSIQLWDLQADDPLTSSRVIQNTYADKLAFSPDGKWLAAGTDNGGVLLWKIPFSEGLLANNSLYIGEKITALAFSADSRWLTASTLGGGTYLLDLETVQQDGEINARRMVRSGTERVNLTEISLSNQWLATGNELGSVRLWDLTKNLASPPYLKEGLDGPVNALVITPDSKYMAAASRRDTKIYFWNLSVPGNPPFFYETGLLGINTLAYAPRSDGKWQLVIGFQDGGTRMLTGRANSIDGKMVEVGFQNGGIASVAFSPNGQWRASGSKDQSVMLWNNQDPDREPVLLGGHTKSVSAVLFSPQNRWLAVSGEDTTVRLWNLEKDIEPFEPLVLWNDQDAPWINSDTGFAQWKGAAKVNYATGEVEAIDFNDLDQPAKAIKLDPRKYRLAHGYAYFSHPYLAFQTTSKVIYLADLSKSEVAPISLGTINDLNYLDFSPDGKWLMALSQKNIRVWNIEKEPALVIDFKADPSTNQTISWGLIYCPQKCWAFAMTETQTANGDFLAQDLLWDLTTPSAPPRAISGNAPLSYFDISSDGKWFARSTGFLTLWNLDEQTPKGLELPPQEGGVSDLSLSRDGRWLAAGTNQGTIDIWDVSAETPKVVISIQAHSDLINRVFFNPDSKWLVSTGQDGTLAILNTTTLKTGAAPEPLKLKGHTGPIWDMFFSPNGKTLVTAGQDGTARLWNLAQPDSDSIVLKGYHDGAITPLNFTPDGQFLVTSSDQGLEIFHINLPAMTKLVCEFTGRSLTEQEWELYMPRGYPYVKTCE